MLLLCFLGIMLLLGLLVLVMLHIAVDSGPRLLFNLAPMRRTLTDLGNSVVCSGLGAHVPLGDLAPGVEIDLGLQLRVLEDHSGDGRERRAAPVGRRDGCDRGLVDRARSLGPAAPVAVIVVLVQVVLVVGHEDAHLKVGRCVVPGDGREHGRGKELVGRDVDN